MSAIYECECDSFEMYEEQDSFEMAEAVPGPGVAPGGMTGQVLKKRSDANYDTEWADESGGGGGTSDYTHLSNKPQINGHTLTGNQTGADLGLVNAVTGKQLSTEDYTTAEKTKLSGIEAQANKTVIDDTLTNTGEAADAKAVGDEISQLESDVQDLQDIAGDGALDSDFTATDLTGAANELKDDVSGVKNTLNHKADLIYDTASGDIASFPDGADGLPVKDLTVGIEPVQSGTGDPSPTNVRPISGWTGCNVTRTGKNLFDKTAITKDYMIGTTGQTYYSAGRYYSDLIPIKGNTNYYLKSVLGSGSFNTSIHYDKYGNIIGDKNIGGSQTQSGTITSFPNSAFMRINGNYNVIDSAYVVEGSAEVAYEAYQGTTLPISWQSEAGTVYGGTLDVTSGVLTVDYLLFDFATNQSDWYMASTSVSGKQRLAVPCPDLKIDDISWFSQGLKCNIFQVKDGGETYAGIQGISVDSNKRFVIYKEDLQTVNDWKAFATANNMVAVYKLATPQTYQLDPVTVLTLLGQNNIWADTGDSTVEYPCDTKLYVSNKMEEIENLRKTIAPIEDGDTASQLYGQGRYFFRNGKFCKAKTDILQNAQFTLNTNYEVTTVANELYDAINPFSV